jgi:hypothetical protein
MLRRELVIGAAALALAGCGQTGDKPVTIADVIAEIKKQCSFLPELDSIVKLITTVVSGFDPGAGAATVIAAAVAKNVADMVCNAVKVQMAQMSVEKKSLGGSLTVLCNGVPIVGAYSAST